MRISITSLLILASFWIQQEQKFFKLDHSYIQKIYWFDDKPLLKSLQTDSTYSNLRFLGEPVNDVVIERNDVMNNGYFELKFEGLKGEYRESVYEGRSNNYRCMNLMVTSSDYEIVFDQTRLKVGMKVDDLGGVLKGAVPESSQKEVIVQFIPTDFSMTITINQQSRKIEQIEFSEIFY